MERGDIDMDKKHGQNKEKSMYMTCGLFIQYNGTRALQRITHTHIHTYTHTHIHAYIHTHTHNHTYIRTYPPIHMEMFFNTEGKVGYTMVL